MNRRKLVVALVGAIGLSMLMAPANAAPFGPTVAPPSHVGRLLVSNCGPLTGLVRLAFHSVGATLVVRSVQLHHDQTRPIVVAAVIVIEEPWVETWVAPDVEVTAVNTGTGGTAIAVERTRRARDVDVTALNTGPLGTAIAVAETHRARTVDVTAVNTATLGTAVAVADTTPSHKSSTKNVTSNVTAINTGILGTAIAVGGGGNGNVTAVNTGILGTAIAVGGGGDVGYPIGL